VSKEIRSKEKVVEVKCEMKRVPRRSRILRFICKIEPEFYTFRDFCTNNKVHEKVNCKIF
jgi:hypothetical protein